MNKSLPQQAVEECRRELLSACRMPIEPEALTFVVNLLHHRFEELLGDAKEGPRRWTAAGPLMRDNSRFLGAFAEFFANREGKELVGQDDLMLALQLVRAQCQALQAAGRVPHGFEFCTEVPLATEAQKAFVAPFLPTSSNP